MSRSEHESAHWVPCLKDFYLFFKGKNFRGVSGEDINRIFTDFHVCPFKVMVSIHWSALE